MGGGGHLQKGVSRFLHMSLQLLQLLRLLQKVGLVAHHDLRALGQRGAELCQLLVDLLEVLDGVAALAAGNIHHMQQQAAALHMTQEVMAQANAIGSTFDQAGDIGADKALFRANAHNAQNRGQRGESDSLQFWGVPR